MTDEEKGIQQIGPFRYKNGILPRRRTESGDRFSHNTVAVLEAFATSVIALHLDIHRSQEQFRDGAFWGDQAYHWARGAVRCARLLTVKEDYR